MTAEQVRWTRERNVEMIYVAKNGSFTQRKVKIIGITDTQIYAYCHLRKQVRTFLLDQILAIFP
ncbi:hypothetical protein KO561_10005 [Radiobacillus kanasensis]|uniref:WYL domain-containing protein n=1 Tax=Radiobacillus kanasensis TaxID=2844358 RepID=UPI001E318A46|nr:hypothetical protein [Radiobacillus kanasensis]UFU01244.1 hypothetical protein KO561_10005 [Radiobacillus kanasensis]